MTNDDKPLFQSAKDIHFDKLKVKSRKKKEPQQVMAQSLPMDTDSKAEPELKDSKPKPQPNEIKQGPSKYQRAVYEGLCLKCFYEGTDDINRRPRAPMDAFCPVCLKKMDILIDSG
jgi:hypothetical protein